MKKIEIVLLGILITSFNILYSADRHVGSGQTHATIQAAVDASANGDIVVVHAGTYREQITIPSTKGITIKNNGTDVVEINGCDLLTGWSSVSGSVYKATMNWDLTEGVQVNQLFVNNTMIGICRWPEEKSGSILLPDEAVMDAITGAGSEIGYHIYELTDAAFDQPDGKWDGAEIWINLANQKNGADGQGLTGYVVSTNLAAKTIKFKVNTSLIISGPGSPWFVGDGTHYHIYNPTAAKVSSVGIQNYLTAGTWFKDGNNLYIRLKDNSNPASSSISAKKRAFAIKSGTTLSNVTISGINFFATSITTDNEYLTRKNYLSAASNNIIENCNFKYVFHFTDQTGQWQSQWTGTSGIIISGKNNIFRNCTIQYSSGSGLSCYGTENRIINNTIYDVNYSVAECGAVNFGCGNYPNLDNELAYNTIYNTPQQAVNMRGIYNSNVNRPGLARLHHNKVHDFMLRCSDSGGFDTFGNDSKYARIDHNIIYNAAGTLQIGIYLDFGAGPETFDARFIIDHNVIYNVERPIQINHTGGKDMAPALYNNVLIATGARSGIVNDMGGNSIDVKIINNISTGSVNSFSQSILKTNVTGTTAQLNALFTNPASGDYTLKSSAATAIDKGTSSVSFDDAVLGSAVDIGAFEYGKTAWSAGSTSGTLPTEFALSDTCTPKGLSAIQGIAKTFTIPVKILEQGGFTDALVSLTLATDSEVTATTSKTTGTTGETVTLNISTSATTKPGIHKVVLTGTSGSVTSTNEYFIQVYSTGVISSIRSREDTVFVLINTPTYIVPIAYDADGLEYYPQPAANKFTIQQFPPTNGAITAAGIYTSSTLGFSLIKFKYGALDVFEKVQVVATLPTPVAINESKINFSVFPNPVSELLTIEFMDEDRKQIEIYNSNGQSLFTKNIEAKSITINSAEYANGIYFIKVTRVNTYEIRKVVFVK